MKILNAFFLLLLSVSILAAQKKQLPDDVVASIRERIENGHSPGIVVGIIDKDGPQYYAFGAKTAGGEPVDEHSIYEIGSISKTFTATLLAQNILNGKMKADDPAQQYLPKSVTMPMRNGRQITLGELSDHTSGLPRLPANLNPADPSNPYADYTVEQMYAFLSGYELPRDIGSQYEYSNLAQGLLGHILALQAGKSYEELLIENIAGPLGMDETKITFDEQMKKNLAMGYSQGMQVPNWDFPTLAGAGAIRSSLHDMLRYIGANMGLIKSDFYPAMQLAHTMRHDKAGGIRVGLGWHISKGSDGDVIWHNGGTGGYRTFAGFVRETGEGVVVLTNSTKGADDIGFHLLNPEANLIKVKKSALAVIRKAIDAEGPDAGLNAWATLKNEHAGDYELNEDEMNTQGYIYLNEGNTKAALAVFRINAEEYPNSSNVFDSYGEALMKDGQKDEAVVNYKKSLELNPGNDNAVKMLEKMGVTNAVDIPEVAEEVLESYVGTYNLAPGFDIEITREGTQLFGQATGQGRFELFPKSETEFYLKVVAAQVVFNAKDGQVESLTLFQGGQELPAKKMEK
ncbi:MAG TPA: serine hydrolase [Flavilitoribacter sp.]|nr:serine hydrolase [Flavilitoribacter sp.]HMQ86648.1 serine hydrolase [Flavilitoribacter sp.]